MSYYARHVFFCCNQREPGAQCCNNHGSSKIRINQSGCLDRCKEGPVMVIYPDAVWYTYVDQGDIDEIISEHLQNGRIVERLRI